MQGNRSPEGGRVQMLPLLPTGCKSEAAAARLYFGNEAVPALSAEMGGLMVVPVPPASPPHPHGNVPPNRPLRRVVARRGSLTSARGHSAPAPARV